MDLLLKLVDESPKTVNATAGQIHALRLYFGDTEHELIKTDGSCYFITQIRVVREHGGAYRDRLFRAFAARSLRTNPTAELQWRGKPLPANIVFAGQRAVIGPKCGRRLLKPGEHKRRDEDFTTDELTGDGVALHQITVHLTRYDLESAAVPSGDCHHALSSGRSTIFLGGPYSNEYLAGLERKELENSETDIEDTTNATIDTLFGARFDMNSPLKEGKNRIIFHRYKKPPMIKEMPIMHTESDPGMDYAVVRRWLTPQKNDAIMVAGLTAQGTLAATNFICEPESVSKLFEQLRTKGVADDVWEWTQWDALLEIKLTEGKAFNDILPRLIWAEPRLPLPQIRKERGQ